MAFCGCRKASGTKTMNATNATNATNAGAANGGRKFEVSTDHGARARAVALGGMRRGLLATAELVKACGAARRGEGMTAQAAASWRHAVSSIDCGGHGAEDFAPGAAQAFAVDGVARSVESVARSVEGAAWLTMAARLGSAVRISWAPSRWRAAAARVAARHGDAVREAAAAGADVVAAVRISGGELGAALAIMRADARAARVESLHARISGRIGGEFARRAARRRAEAAPTAETLRAAGVNRALDLARAEAEAATAAAQVGSPEWRAIIAHKVEREAARRGTLGPAALPVRAETRHASEAARRAYRSAVALSEASGARWLMRHAAKFALPMLERDDTGKRRLRSATAEASGNGGAEVERGADVAAEVVAVYRHAALQLVPRYLATLARMIEHDGGRVSVDRLAKLGGVFRRAFWRRADKRAGAVLYASTGRGGRESALPWEVEDAAGDAAGEALAVAMGSDGAAGDDTATAEPAAASGPVPSSDPRTLHAGGVGKRATVEARAWRAIAKARAEVHRKAARVAAGGKGTGMVRKGAVELSATLASVTAALRSAPLPDAVVSAMVTGAADGISDKWRQRVKVFRDAAGVVAPEKFGTASARFRAARCRTLHKSGRVPHRGDKREDAPHAADWQGFDGELVAAAVWRPLGTVGA